jgi:hypothetical protein
MRKALFLSGLMLCVIFLPVTSAVDGDGDGVDDSVDICRFAAGNATSTSGLGCPDSNGDGLADFEQAVTTTGMIQLLITSTLIPSVVKYMRLGGLKTTVNFMQEVNLIKFIALIAKVTFFQ